MLAVIGLPLVTSLALYGPVLLSRHIVHSSVPGWFMIRILLSILVLAGLFFAVVWFSGNNLQLHETIVVFAALQVGVVYLHWRLKNKRTYYDPLRDGDPGLMRQKAATIGNLVVVSILLFVAGYLVWGYVKHERYRQLAIQNAPAEWKQLRVGMGTQEVVNLIGPPLDFSFWGPPGTWETWQYSFGLTAAPAFGGPYVLTVKTGKVISINIR
jgi:hypothetical protein